MPKTFRPENEEKDFPVLLTAACLLAVVGIGVAITWGLDLLMSAS